MSISCRLTELVYQVAESFLWVKITAVRHFHSPKFPSTLECQSAIWSLDRSASSRPSFRRWWHPQARKGCTWRTESKSSNKFGANCIIHHHWLATKRILAGARQGLKKKCLKGTRLLNFWLCSFSSTAPTWQWIYGKWFQVTCWFPIFLSGRSGVVFMLAILNTAIMIMFMIHVMTCASSWKGKGKVCGVQTAEACCVWSFENVAFEILVFDGICGSFVSERAVLTHVDTPNLASSFAHQGVWYGIAQQSINSGHTLA